MKEEIYKAIGKERGKDKIEKDLENLFIENGITQFKIGYECTCDGSGYDIYCISVAWVDELYGLDLITDVIESC